MEELKKIAKEVRRETLQLALDYGEHHVAPSLSCVEILVALYNGVLKPDDKFILSKGHGCLSWYVVLRKRGFNPAIKGHPDIDEENGVFCTTGSLGHGLPIGVGMAVARKILGKPGKVFVLMSDGECQEGSTWESLNLVRKFKLDNLVIIVDSNKLQALQTIKEVLGQEDNLKQKFFVFGCSTAEVDGHNFYHLMDVFNTMNHHEGRPLVVIANTIKGKGISYMEGKPIWHNRLPNKDELKLAWEELK